MIIDGSSDYRTYILEGDTFLEHFVQLGGLRPTHRVLEVGAATGRMARPLTRFLDRTAEYHGIEVVADAVEWAQREITTRHPNFHFIHADIYNQAYYPGGVQRAGEYRFPFADASFDFAFAASVFTHMLPADVQHYLSEIERVLRPGGRILATFFALTRTARAAMQAGTTGHSFGHQFEGYSALDPTCPEAALAYEENDLRRLYRNAGLTIIDPLWPGAWTGVPESKTYQDIVVAMKPFGTTP